MLAQSPMMDDGEMQRLCSIVIIDLNCKEIHLKVSQTGLIIVRFLNDLFIVFV